MIFNTLQAAILSVVSVTAFAENNFYVAPFGSYLHPSSNAEADDGFGAGLAIGKQINEHFNVEVRGFWQKYDNDYSCCHIKNVTVSGNSQLTGGTLDVQWFLLRDTLSPYVIAAVGGLNTDYKMQSTVFGKTVNYAKESTSFIFETGVGSTYNVTDYLAFRGDVRYRLNTLPMSVGSKESSVFNDLTVNFGFVMPFT
jgi:OOP family OmpA-OmpF porin